jgi:toxoflavin synthase
MSAGYDDIGSIYNMAKRLPIASLELATLQAQIGNVDGLEILDLACGTGFYSRKLVEWGAKRVVGLDISTAMIEAARRESEGDDRLDFHVADCGKPLDVGRFDVVIAVWLLNYASNKEELLAMWQNISKSLKPGGRCIGILGNQDMLQLPNPEEPRFGLSIKFLENVKNGVRLLVSVDADIPFSFECYMIEPALYAECAGESGISGLQWIPPTKPNDVDFDFGSFLRCPHFRAFTGVRSSE